MRLEHLLSGAPYEDNIQQYICSIIKNGTENLETAPSRRKRQGSPEDRSSTVRGKQDRNPALLLGYTFVYGNHIYRSPAHEPAGTMEEGQSGDRSPGVPLSLRGNEDGK